MKEPVPSEAQADNRRDVSVLELTAVPGRHGELPWASSSTWLRRVLQQFHKLVLTPRNPPTFATSAGEMVSVAGAIEGNVKHRVSLDGVLKQAEIERAYAEARAKNAEAERLEMETARLRQDLAFERLKRSLELFEKLGVPVNLVTLPDGRTAIAVGEALVSSLTEEGLPAIADDTSERSESTSFDTPMVPRREDPEDRR